MNHYGQLPKVIRILKLECKEMMFYQYLPIKLGQIDGNWSEIKYDKRLDCFYKLIHLSCKNFRERFGNERFNRSYIYLTVRHLYQEKETSFNRKGYHSDGFMTDDINYIWSNCSPTVFNNSDFKLTLDDTISIDEMEQQAEKSKEVTPPNNALLRLNQFNSIKYQKNL